MSSKIILVLHERPGFWAVFRPNWSQVLKHLQNKRSLCLWGAIILCVKPASALELPFFGWAVFSGESFPLAKRWAGTEGLFDEKSPFSAGSSPFSWRPLGLARVDAGDISMGCLVWGPWLCTEQNPWGCLGSFSFAFPVLSGCWAPKHSLLAIILMRQGVIWKLRTEVSGEMSSKADLLSMEVVIV